MSSSTKCQGSDAKKAPYDDYRGIDRDGGWFLTLDEAKKRTKNEFMWWLETETEASDPVCISSEKPVWMYDDGTMYIGSWRETRIALGVTVKHSEHGSGIQLKKNGSCYVGSFENGLYHGWGRSFWLKNSKVWEENSIRMPDSHNSDSRRGKKARIIQPTIVCEERGVFLPHEYYGKFLNGARHCSDGTVTLKDETKKIGPWAENSAVTHSWFSGSDSMVPNNTNWWTDHTDYHMIDFSFSSPASRSARINNNSNNNSSSSNISSHISSNSSSSSSSNNNNANNKRNKQQQQTPTSTITTSTLSRSADVASLPKYFSVHSTRKRNDKKKKRNTMKITEKTNEKKQNSTGTGHDDTEEKDNIQLYGNNGNNNDNDIIVIDGEDVVPDDAPSSSHNTLSSSAMAVMSTSTLTTPAIADFTIYTDAILSEKDEVDFPLHAAVKFGDIEFVQEELQKIAKGNESNTDDSNNKSIIDINTVDSKGRTALDLAALTGQTNLVKLLRKVNGHEFRYMSGPRLKLLAEKRSKDVNKYLIQIRATVE